MSTNHQIQVVFRELAYLGIAPAIYGLLMFFTGGVGIDYGLGTIQPGINILL